MTSDYLKQLQLTKQLEQKAKEAAKNRKAAEEKLAEAERSLSSAKEMNIEIGEAETILAKGNAAYGKRDYNAALSSALKSLEILGSSRTEMTGETLSSAESVLALIPDRDGDRKQVEDCVAETRRLLSESKPEEAFAAAERALKSANQFANQRMSEMFAQAQHLIDVAEKQGLAVSAKKQVLAKAIKLQDEGDRGGALAKLGSCVKGIQESFTKLLDERVGRLQEMVEEASSGGGDTAPITEAVAQARHALSEARIEDSLAQLEAAEGAIVPVLIKAVEVKLAAQEERSNWLIGQGVNVTKYIAVSRKAKEAAESGLGEESFEWLRRSEKALRDCEADLVLEHVEKLKPRMLIGKKIAADMSSAMAKLEEARMATVYGRAVEALELVVEASAELDDSLDGIKELEEELERTRATFLQARAMHIISGEATALVTRSRKIALTGKVKESVEGLGQARALLVRMVQDRCARQILKSELMVTAGWSIGADVDDDASELDAVVKNLIDGSIENVSVRLAAITKALEERIAAKANEEVLNAAAMTDLKVPFVDLTDARGRYEEAAQLLQGKQYYEAYMKAQEATEAAGRVQRESLDRLTMQASSLLEIGRQLGIESQTLNQKMTDVKRGDGFNPGSIRSISDVIQFASSLIKDELTRSLSQLMRSSATARKKGVATANVDRIAEDASRTLVAGDLNRCFDLLREAEKELEKTTALHNEVYDLIVLLSRLTGELHLPPESKVTQLLTETKRLFEAGKYDGARISAKNCYQEAEGVGAEALAPKKIQEAKDMVPVIQQLGLDVGSANKAVSDAQATLKKGDAVSALNQAKEAKRKMTDTVNERIEAEIAEVRKLFSQGGLDDNDASGALGIVEKAENLLESKRYSDALRAIRFAHAEAGQLLSLRKSVSQELEEVEISLREIADLGIDVREAREVFEQALKYRSSGRNNLVLELARKALTTAQSNTTERLEADIFAVENEVGLEELKGKDLAVIEAEMLVALRQKIDQHRYTEARRMVEFYHDALAGLRVLRDQCASSLSKLAEGLVRIPRGSSVMAETEKLMTKAQTAFAEGAFQEALGLTEECRASGASAIEWHDRCAKRMEDARSQLLAGEGRRALDPEITALVDTANKALEDGRYEDMDWAILKTARLHQRAKELSTRRGLADLINLIRLFPEAGLHAEDLPPEAKSLADVRMAEPGEIRNLSEIVGSVRSRVRKGIENKIARVRAKSESSKGDPSVCLSLLAVAERSLSEEKLEQALALVQDAEMIIGASPAEIQEFRALAHKHAELQALAVNLGADGGRHLDLYRQVLRSRDVPTAVHRLREATASLDHSLSAYLPRLEVTRNGHFGGQAVRENGHGLINSGTAPAIQVKIINEEDKVDHVTDILWPQTAVGLPNGQGAADRTKRFSISYRALFLPRPLVKRLDAST